MDLDININDGDGLGGHTIDISLTFNIKKSQNYFDTIQVTIGE